MNENIKTPLSTTEIFDRLDELVKSISQVGSNMENIGVSIDFDHEYQNTVFSMTLGGCVEESFANPSDLIMFLEGLEAGLVMADVGGRPPLAVRPM